MIDIFRSYWSKRTQTWTKEESAGIVNAATRSSMTDSSVQQDFPYEDSDYKPGLQIRYRWSQKTIVNTFSPDYVYPAEKEEQTSEEVTIPFSFSFGYILSSPDGTVDISGANLKIADLSTGDVIASITTEKRKISGSGKKENHEEIVVQFPVFGDDSLERQVKVSAALEGHDIVCDHPLCTA